MPRAFSFTVIFAGLLSVAMVATADAQQASAVANKNQQSASNDSIPRGFLSDGPEDPENLLSATRLRRTQKNSLFSVSPLQGLHEATDRAKESLDDATHLSLAVAFTHLFQWLSEAPLSDTTWGTASGLDILGTWKLVDRGGPYQGQVFFQVQGRWEYGTTGPERLGAIGVGSTNGTANTFSAYVPTFLPLRNLYWQQGSQEAGWIYRVGKITPDATLSTSAHIASPLTFLPTAGTGPFANALTDSGLGIAAAWFINRRLKLLGIISDANADRSNLGDIGAGDFYKAIELGVKIAPKTEKAGYSKITLWHTDATKDGQAVNGHLGPEGWGFFLKFEQELTSSGRAIGILRYGRSFNGSAFYEQQIGVHFVLKDPTGVTRLQNDLLGVAFNWAQANVSGARGESNVEVFYRLPVFPQVDMSLSYQLLIHPALDPNNNSASAFGLRLRTTF